MDPLTADFRTESLSQTGLKCALAREANLRGIHDAYNLLDLIGMGTYGIVYRGRDRSTGQLVAMKLVPKYSEFSKSEIDCLSSCNHPSIIGFREVVLAEDKNDLYIIMELADTDLRSLILNNDQHIDENRVRGYMIQLLQGVAYLHNKGIIHRDLKTPNLLLTNRDELKICDFGCSRCCQFDEKRCCRLDVYCPDNYSLEVGTRPYLAPEILLQTLEAEEEAYAGEYSAAMDMWSIGCIMAELICRKQLFGGEEEEEEEESSGFEFDKDMNQFFNIKNLIPSQGQAQDFHKLREKIPPQALSPQGFDLLTKLLAFSPTERINVNDALGHPWFSQVIWWNLVLHGLK